MSEKREGRQEDTFGTKSKGNEREYKGLVLVPLNARKQTIKNQIYKLGERKREREKKFWGKEKKQLNEWMDC